MTEQLLRDYVQTGSESAFRELVDRYINLVYSTAYRRLGGDAHLAQDTVQTVFSDLARKASTLPATVMLGGWLHTHTCFVTSAMLRTNRRREAREKEAMEIFASSATDDWKTIAPILDDVVNQLAPADRDAVILRFFEGLDFRTIGARIGATEDTAQKRVSRAVEKLRVLLEQRGATLSIAGLATLLAGESILAAPAGLAARVAGNALAHAAARVGLLATLLALITPGKIAVIAAALIALLGFFALKQNSSPPTDTSPVKNAEIVSASSAAGDTLTAAPSGSDTTAATTPRTNVLRLTILAADSGKPVPNVIVKYRASADTGATSLTLVARRDGTCDVPLPPPHVTRLTLTTQLDDFADTRLEWNPPRGETIPTSYTLRLQRPVIIGGRVVDPDGRPVPGARVGFNHQEDPSARKLPQDHEFSWIEVTTGEDGRWEIRRIAADMIRRLYGGASHSNYVHSKHIFVDRMSEVEEQLKSGTHVFTLGEAVIVRGLVTDQNGMPVAGAEVLVGGRGDVSARRQISTPDGAFALAGCKPGKNLLTAEAKGFASTTIEIEATSDAPPFQLALAPGKMLRVRVVDKVGQPVKGATLMFHNERDLHTGKRKGPILQSNFRPKTDENGLALWDNAPDMELTCDVDAPNHMRVDDVKFRPDGMVHVLVLPNAVNISGTVHDEESGEPIPRFRIVSGRPDNNPLGPETVSWSGLERHWLDFSGGTFRHAFREALVSGMANPGYVLRFEAEGYTPFISRTISPDESHARFDVKLRASVSNAVTVLFPDGRPATDTDVALVSATASLRLTPNGFSRRNAFDRGALLTTDAKGRFTYIPNERVLRIIAAHPLGYAEATPAQLHEQAVLRLQPWGRIEGVLTSNGKPITNQRLSLDLAIGLLNSVSLDFETFEAKTDAEGRFTFAKVPPTGLRLQRIEQAEGANSWAHMPLERVDVGPGETKMVRLDGHDRRFTLQLRWPDGLNADPQWHIHLSLQKSMGESLGAPHAPRARIYFLQPTSNGSYSAKNVLPGEYRVHARVGSQQVPGGPTALEALGDGTVIVPDDQSGIIEIGDLHVAPPAQASN
jgi:RNA polymerase sigma factor (sigma-70 family)